RPGAGAAVSPGAPPAQPLLRTGLRPLPAVLKACFRPFDRLLLLALPTGMIRGHDPHRRDPGAPANRGKPGPKYHLLVDRGGIPLAVGRSAANTYDRHVGRRGCSARPNGWPDHARRRSVS